MGVLTLLMFACLAPQEVVESPAPDPEASPRGREVYLGREIARTMHWTGAPWLLRETREDEENGEALRAWLDVAEGAAVCDLGCGNGYHTLPLARTVGEEGRVFGVDLQPEMLRLLEERAAATGLENLEAIEATIDDPKLAKASCDLVLMVDVYHELSHPVRVLGHVRAALREGGELVLVEFREEVRAVPIKPRHKMSKAQIVREMAANGFVLVRETDDLPWQHAMAFGVAEDASDELLAPREVARGLVAALAGEDPRIVEPYLAPKVDVGDRMSVSRRSLSLEIGAAMRRRELLVPEDRRLELRKSDDSRITVRVLEGAGSESTGTHETSLQLVRDNEGRWVIDALDLGR